MRILDATMIRSLALPERAIEWMRDAMTTVSARNVELPLRQAMKLPGDYGAIGIMPGYVGGDVHSAGVKLVSLVPPHRRKGSSHLGLITLYDGDGLVPSALLCSATITAIRTAAATAVATDILARKDATSLLIMGNGEQAEAHITAPRCIRPFTDIRIWARNPDSPAALALAEKYNARLTPDLDQALCDVDVVCTVTSATEPILFGERLKPGMHLNLVGASTSNAREADDEVVRRSRYFVDYVPSALAQAGELLHAIENGVVAQDQIEAEIGSVLSGQSPGRQTPQDITVYKSLGIAAQDIIAARKTFELAERSGLGQVVTL